jgi:hypothetical protein
VLHTALPPRRRAGCPSSHRLGAAQQRGTSVTYAAEQLAAEVIRSHRLPTPLLWIEHWAKESTDGEEETCELRFRARPPKGAPEMELMLKGAEYIYRNTRLLRHYPGVAQAPQARLADRDRLPNNGVLMPLREPGAEWTRKATAKQLPRTPHEGMIQGNENRADRNAGLRCRMA